MYNNCILCGQFKQLNRLQICSHCFREDEQILEKAKLRIEQDGKMPVFDLAERIDIKPERIFMWLQQRRIKRNLFQHSCPKCGRDLLNNFCNCTSTLYADEAIAAMEFAARPKEKFHTGGRLQRLKEYYWDNVSIIRRKQKRDIWIPS